MELIERTSGAVRILELTGRFDAYGAPRVMDWLASATEAGHVQIVTNLAGVNFVDSTALATLVRGLKRCRQQNGDLHVCCLQQPVRIIFELTWLDKSFDIFADEAAAVEAFGD